MSVVFTIFIFQAEAGIRVYKVTGVQTCALPILLEKLREGMRGCVKLSGTVPGTSSVVPATLPAANYPYSATSRDFRGPVWNCAKFRTGGEMRSEERGVGNGWQSINRRIR